MQTTDTAVNKADDRDRPAIVWLTTGAQIEADHHFISNNGAVVHVSLDRSERPAGIDLSIPVARIAAIQRVSRRDVARAAEAAVSETKPKTGGTPSDQVDGVSEYVSGETVNAGGDG